LLKKEQHQARRSGSGGLSLNATRLSAQKSSDDVRLRELFVLHDRFERSAVLVIEKHHELVVTLSLPFSGRRRH